MDIHASRSSMFVSGEFGTCQINISLYLPNGIFSYLSFLHVSNILVHYQYINIRVDKYSTGVYPMD